MSNTELFFDRPWLLLLIIPALLLLVLPWLRIPKARRRSARHIAVLALRSLATALLVLVLARTAITRTSSSQAVILVVDLSESTASVQDAMAQNAQELTQLLGRDTCVGVVTFGSDCVFTEGWDGHSKPVRSDATDISEALEFAYNKLPEDRAGRIILLTDGKQTDGSVESTAQYLHSQGVRLDCIHYEIPLYDPEVQLMALTGPRTAFVGTSIELVAQVQSNTYSDITLTLYDNDIAVSTIEADSAVGIKPVSFAVSVDDPQPHTYRVEVSAKRDVLVQNNWAQLSVPVRDKPSVLLLSGNTPSAAPLAQVLQPYCHLQVMAAGDAPRSISALCQYDGVILQDVNYKQLPYGYDTTLETYVTQYGRGLLVIGGPNTLMYGNMQGTALEPMLPADMFLTRSNEEEPVAMMLVMDCSLSMSQDSTYMTLAKQGAIRCIESMSDNDYVGIISFNRLAQVEAPLEKNSSQRKEKLARTISSLTAGQGTYYTDALDLAHQELLQSDAKIKHVIFISDGSPADHSYRDLLPQIAQDGISITTIGLGYTANALETMATSTGGKYYYVEDANTLPDIMLTLTQSVSVNSLITGQFSVEKNADSDLGQGISQIPSVRGYLGMTAKKDTQVHLRTQEDHPIYCSNQQGAGRVSIFTGDLTHAWSDQWLQTQAGQTLIGQIVSHFIGQAQPNCTMQASLTPFTKTVQLTVTTADPDIHTLYATVDGRKYPLHRLESGMYFASLDAPGPGIHPVTVIRLDSQGQELERLELPLCTGWSREYDLLQPSGAGLCQTITDFSGGTVTEDLQALASVRMGSVTVIFDFTTVFSVLILLLVLADIAIRKVRLRDLKNYWLQFKHRRK